MSTDAKHTEGKLHVAAWEGTVQGKSRASGRHAALWAGDEEKATLIAPCGPENDPESVANADRLAACWNAFDGMTTEQVERIGAGGVERMAKALALLSASAANANRLQDGGRIVPPEIWADICFAIVEARAVLARLEGKG